MLFRRIRFLISYTISLEIVDEASYYQDMNTTNSIKCMVIVAIYESVPSYPSGTHEIEVEGFGTTFDTADRDIAARLASWNARPYGTGPGTTETRAHRAEVRIACEACGVRGVVPGFKRKPCPACGGRGVRVLASVA